MLEEIVEIQYTWSDAYTGDAAACDDDFCADALRR